MYEYMMYRYVECKDLKRMILEPVWLNNKDISKENV